MNSGVIDGQIENQNKYLKEVILLLSESIEQQSKFQQLNKNFEGIDSQGGTSLNYSSDPQLEKVSKSKFYKKNYDILEESLFS